MAWRGANIWLGAQLSTGSRVSLALWPLHQDSGHMLGGSSGFPRGQKQDPPSFLKALAESWYRVPPVPSCGLKQPESSRGTLHPGRAWVQKARSSADLCWPLSGTLPALPFPMVSSSVDRGLVPLSTLPVGSWLPDQLHLQPPYPERMKGTAGALGPPSRPCYPPTPPSLRTFLWVSWWGM